MANKKAISSVFNCLKNSMHCQGNHCNHIISRCHSIFTPCHSIFTPPLTLIFQAKCYKSRARSKTFTLKPKTVSPLSRKSGKSGKNMRTAYNDQIESHYVDDVEVSRDDFEELAHAVTTYGDRHKSLEASARFWRDMTAFQNMIRAKTMEQKFFRPPKKPNLLTWAAKEQMKSLHESDPAEWNVEILAKTFPVGIESSRKIISSRIRLRQLQDVLKHDLYVKRNWEIIFENLKANKMDADNIVKDFLENLHSINILQNALPLPDFDKPEMTRNSIKGTFSLIVQDALQKKNDENKKLTEKLKQLHLYLSETLSEIQDLLLQVGIEQISNKYNKSTSIMDSQESLKALIQSRFKDTHDGSGDRHSEFEKVDTMDDIDLSPDAKITKLRKAPRKISLTRPNQQSKPNSYHVDDCVYDENGEFLYRRP